MNIKELRVKINEKGYSNREIAEKLGIDASTFYRKIANTGKTFSVEEAQRLAQLLDLSGAEAAYIFFT